ncbi:MAG: hypothetical protein JSV12_01365 [Candidatus Bathyarchaeota archaeon]|nr:MAG: hypothetical protein JSV12_01365 [Candidatus Bathyarchaeota archaeon]
MRKKMLLIFLMIPLIFTLLRANTIQITATPDAHDIAVLSVTPNPTLVTKGELVNITVVVENQGNATEMFNVTVYYDTNTIETQNVSNLAVGANTSLTFVWNTTDVHIRKLTGSVPYKINATASVVSGETDTADNTLVSISRVSVVESPYLAVVPHSTINPNLTTGSTYTVSVVTDYNGSDITGYEFTLYYNPNVLHGVNTTNGDLIVGGSAMFNPGTPDNTNGKITTSAIFFFQPPEWAPLTSGPGTLANVTFEVVGEGESPITLSMAVAEKCLLKGYTEGGAPNGTDYNIINIFVNARQAAHGYFRNTLAEVVHDVAVVDVKLNSTNLEIGEHAKITVEIKNNGTVFEDVTINVERLDEKGGAPWPIGKNTTRNLAAGANTSLTFIFDTTGITSGTYSIKAEAEPVSGETNIDNNILESAETIIVRAKPEQPIPIELIIGIGVAVVAVIIIVIVIVRRGKKPIPE